MPDPQIAAILQKLNSGQAQDGWTKFLELYSPTILQVAQLSTSDLDAAADCFLFTCEQLSQNNFRRLLRFRPEGAASFTTWLKVVVRNLYCDWHRKKFGRRRIFRSIQSLPRLTRAVYQHRCEEGLSADATFLLLRAEFPALAMSDVTRAEGNARHALTSRQNWLLSIRRNEEYSGNAGALPELQVMDQGPSPETVACLHEERRHLAAAFAHLPVSDRMILRWRYEQALPLQKVAHLSGLDNAQTADRRIKDILQRLRRQMG